jgi:autotransporter passenger strand-loop-strand repeat protein
MTQIVSSGQTLRISSGQTSQGVLVLNGGILDILSGGTAVSGGVAGEDDVSAGGVASAMTIGGGFEYVSSGGTAISTTLFEHASQTVYQGGKAEFTVVSFGSFEFVQSGATTSFTTVSGGTEDVLAGVVFSTVVSDGFEYVFSGGLASGTVASNGGILDVFAGGTASGGEAISGGDAFILAGGSAVNLIAGMGGFDFVLAGATLSSATMSGGFLEVESGATATGIVTYAAGGTLQLDEAKTYGLTLTGFGVPGAIDFSAVAYASGTTSATYTSTGVGSGTLTVTDGTHTAQIALLGQYVTANFKLSADGHGGTLIVDPPVSSGLAVAATS